MSEFPKAVRKYLSVHAEAETAEIGAFPGSWGHVLVVPARRETAEFLGGIAAAARAADGRVLVIVVVNGEARDASAGPWAAHLLADLRVACNPATGIPGGSGFLGTAPAFDLLAIDRASTGRELPPRRGVGLARKIGTDVALALWSTGRVASPWIHGSDADAFQPADRFHLGAGAVGTVAWTHPFVHEPSGDPGIDDALARYDASLRYYVEGLRWAGSPWAFHTIGSTITVRADAYAAVRGFPSREAGEDFYLLAKLAKVGKVAEAVTGPVRLRGRTSDRVPFGTGAGVGRILAARARGEPFRVYHPRGFRVLRAWETALRDEAPFASLDAAGLEGVERMALQSALAALEARAALDGRSRRARREWFDAFRTLKFLHAVRDAGLPTLPDHEAWDLAEELGIGQFPPSRPSATPVPTSPAQSAPSARLAPRGNPASGK